MEELQVSPHGVYRGLTPLSLQQVRVQDQPMEACRVVQQVEGGSEMVQPEGPSSHLEGPAPGSQPTDPLTLNRHFWTHRLS